ncbi:hypothetical protein MRX96_016442 [Rhipicephalus microplus]
MFMYHLLNDSLQKPNPEETRQYAAVPSGVTRDFSVDVLFLLPGCPHRSLLLRQLLRCQCHNLLVCDQPHLALCTLSLHRRRLLPRKQQGGHSENDDLIYG